MKEKSEKVNFHSAQDGLGEFEMIRGYGHPDHRDAGEAGRWKRDGICDRRPGLSS